MLIQTTHWHAEADVVVLGCGAAGAVAAIAAHDAGASVIVIDKQTAPVPLTNSYMSAGLIMSPSDVPAARMYMEALHDAGPGLWWTDPEIIQAWAEHTSQAKSFLENMGARLELLRRGGMHRLPGVEAIDIYRFAGMGPGLMRFFYDHMSKRGIEVVRGAKATHLLQGPAGRVIGVMAHRQEGGEKINVKSRRAVVLATGGFEFEEGTKLQYLRVYPFHFCSSPWNTGDGVAMSLEVGAQLWHMNCCSAACVMKFPGVTACRPSFGGKDWESPAVSALPGYGGAGFMARHGDRAIPSAGYVVTDRYGRRYADENIKNHAFSYDMSVYDSKKMVFPRAPSYWIFDQRRLDSGPLSRPVRLTETRPDYMYRWSSDNRVELERGWITRGNTVADLAAALNMQAGVLEKTIRDYNGYCSNRMDPEFEREPGTLVALATPTFYAVELWPGGVNTLGGPRRNARAQVIRADGQPVPGLYGAGELGSVYGMLYPGSGANLAECIALGRVSGENASQEVPW